MRLLPIKTRKITPPKDDLYKIFDECLPPLKEGDILAITSKVVSIHEGRCVKNTKNTNKDSLIIKEAENYIPRYQVPGRRVIITIKNRTLIASSGIDSKNGNGYYILWPKYPFKSAKKIWAYLRKKHKIAKLGIIITDSHSIPLRYGTVGIAIGFFGIDPLLNHTRNLGLFGRRLKFAKTNVVDGLAAASTLIMGESREQTPLVLIRGNTSFNFTDKDESERFFTKPNEDIYKPLLKIFQKKYQETPRRH